MKPPQKEELLRRFYLERKSGIMHDRDFEGVGLRAVAEFGKIFFDRGMKNR